MERQQEFRQAAIAVAMGLSMLPEVKRVVLFGSVANPLKEEVPRFRRFRHWKIAVPHECRDIDLAVWLDAFSALRIIQKTKTRALDALAKAKKITVASHQVDMFLFDAVTNRYAGRLCQFALCPKGKPECRREGCGQPPHLKNDAVYFDPRRLESGVQAGIVLVAKPADEPSEE